MNYEPLDEHKKVRNAFATGKIGAASRKELEHYLIVLANTRRMGDQNWQADTEAFASVVRQLLQVRISEELHWRSMVAAGIAALISLLSLGVSGWQAWSVQKHSRVASAPSASVVAPVPSTPVAPVSPPSKAP